MKSPVHRLRLTVVCILVFSLIGCDAFVRKFTRKQKKTDQTEELVLFPEEYKPSGDKAGLYQQYFVYWKSWQDELIEALETSDSHKRWVSCAQEALKNLVQMKGLLKPELQKKLNVQIGKMSDLLDAIRSDLYGRSNSYYRMRAEHIRLDVMQQFRFEKIKGSLA